jgi:hypothetical protein
MPVARCHNEERVARHPASNVFHVWMMCGLRPKARQIRETADWDMPADRAIDRVDQCVSLEFWA